ncbi:CPBP family glutamic-type intramembrane protease [Maribacter sp. 2-571]|uniref:CPBP family glutamic-type intramembrane protease n=1 Tax=Maribacter sp. 2-571 TaxID=3417569 RepID=UPI003D338418
MTKKVVYFLLIAYSFSVLIGFVARYLKTESNNPNAVLICYAVLMFTPLLSVLIVDRFDFRKIFTEYQFNLNSINFKSLLKYIVLTAFILPFLIVLLVYFFGNHLEIENFGSVILSSSELPVELKKTLPSFLDVKYPILVWFPMMVISSILAGVTINMVFAFGEEVAWRGFLNKHLKLKYFTKNIVIGTIWGAWHIPIILNGHNFGEHYLSGSLIMIVLCISISFFLADSLKQSNTLITPAVLHGIINASAMTLSGLIIKIENPVYGPFGVAFVLAILTILLLQKFILK